MDAARGRLLAVRKDLIKPGDYTKITQELLSFQNPEFPSDDPMVVVPPFLFAWQEKNGILYMPRCFPIEQFVPNLKIVDKLTDGDSIQIQSKIVPLPHQIDALDKMVATNQGVLLAPCGAGKTVMGTEIIKRKGRVALVLVMKEFLMGQWADEIRRFTDAKIAFIGGSAEFHRRHRVRNFGWDTADVVIGTVQTLAKGIDPAFVARVGTVIGDEIHHAAAKTFMQVLSSVKPRNIFGVTATYKRKDGLERLYSYYTGPVIHEIKQSVLEEIGHTLKPKIQFIQTGEISNLPNVGSGFFNVLLNIVCACKPRNDMILNLAQMAEKKQRWTVVLSERVKHCVALCEEYNRRGGDGAVVTGTIGDLDEAFQHRVVFATMRLLEEGLNVKRLNTLILATPFSGEGRMQQMMGRVVRSMEGKTGALIFDLVDEHPITQRMAIKRQGACEKLGWDVKWVSGNAFKSKSN